jgi:hypothetical protein
MVDPDERFVREAAPVWASPTPIIVTFISKEAAVAAAARVKRTGSPDLAMLPRVTGPGLPVRQNAHCMERTHFHMKVVCMRMPATANRFA